MVFQLRTSVCENDFTALPKDSPIPSRIGAKGRHFAPLVSAIRVMRKSYKSPYKP